MESTARQNGCDISLLRTKGSCVTLKTFGSDENTMVICLMYSWDGNEVEAIQKWLHSTVERIYFAIRLVGIKYVPPVIAMMLGQEETMQHDHFNEHQKADAAVVLGVLWNSVQIVQVCNEMLNELLQSLENYAAMISVDGLLLATTKLWDNKQLHTDTLISCLALARATQQTTYKWPDNTAGLQYASVKLNDVSEAQLGDEGCMTGLGSYHLRTVRTYLFGDDTATFRSEAFSSARDLQNCSDGLPNRSDQLPIARQAGRTDEIPIRSARTPRARQIAQSFCVSFLEPVDAEERIGSKGTDTSAASAMAASTYESTTVGTRPSDQEWLNYVPNSLIEIDNKLPLGVRALFCVNHETKRSLHRTAALNAGAQEFWYWKKFLPPDILENEEFCVRTVNDGTTLAMRRDQYEIWMLMNSGEVIVPQMDELIEYLAALD